MSCQQQQMVQWVRQLSCHEVERHLKTIQIPTYSQKKRGGEDGGEVYKYQNQLMIGDLVTNIDSRASCDSKYLARLLWYTVWKLFQRAFASKN